MCCPDIFLVLGYDGCFKSSGFTEEEDMPEPSLFMKAGEIMGSKVDK